MDAQQTLAYAAGAAVCTAGGHMELEVHQCWLDSAALRYLNVTVLLVAHYLQVPA
jgi:hypothetical protein